MGSGSKADGPGLSRLTVGVLGSGHEAHDRLAAEVGRLLADLEVNLLTGGGRGVMTAVGRAFVEARHGRGVCIGILPCSEADAALPRDGYPNAFVELPIYTHLPFSGERGQDLLSRNHINVLSSDALVALPGGAGTLAEISLALRYRKPLVAYYPTDFVWRGVPDSVERAATIDDVRRFLITYLSR